MTTKFGRAPVAFERFAASCGFCAEEETAARFNKRPPRCAGMLSDQSRPRSGAWPGPPAGITINSFASVSLEPPLRLWCVDCRSVRFQPFATAAGFRNCVPCHGQKGLSARPAKPSGHWLGGRRAGPGWARHACRKPRGSRRRTICGQGPLVYDPLQHGACRWIFRRSCGVFAGRPRGCPGAARSEYA